MYNNIFFTQIVEYIYEHLNGKFVMVYVINVLKSIIRILLFMIINKGCN